jgi:hypothetical protein
MLAREVAGPKRLAHGAVALWNGVFTCQFKFLLASMSTEEGWRTGRKLIRKNGLCVLKASASRGVP